MKQGYIKKEDRKKILLISDDLRAGSGVGNISRDIIVHTAHHYNWVQMAGARNNPNLGKKFDASQSMNEVIGIEDASLILYPVEGFGDPFILRDIINQENPDALFLITDPRYFDWVFNMENEIRRKIPIIYYNIWDSPFPYPLWNKKYYKSCDLLMAISKQTKNINEVVLGEDSKNKIISYVPHGVDTKIFKPLPEDDEELVNLNKIISGGKDFDFTLFFNSRNIHRKHIPDVMLSFRLFLDKLPKDKADKCRLVLHTQKLDENGTDLNAMSEYLFGRKSHNIFFSDKKLSAQQLNILYNIGDAQILMTSNEGWGLSLTEALNVGKPIIANVQGGMIDQMRFTDEKEKWIEYNLDFPSNHKGTYKNHGEWAFPLYPTNISIQGSLATPYISDDRCSSEDASEKILELYNMSKEERAFRGAKGREWAQGDEAGFTSDKMALRMIENMDHLFSSWKPRESFNFSNANNYEEKKIQHKLLY